MNRISTTPFKVFEEADLNLFGQTHRKDDSYAQSNNAFEVNGASQDDQYTPKGLTDGSNSVEEDDTANVKGIAGEEYLSIVENISEESNNLDEKNTTSGLDIDSFEEWKTSTSEEDDEDISYDYATLEKKESEKAQDTDEVLNNEYTLSDDNYFDGDDEDFQDFLGDEESYEEDSNLEEDMEEDFELEDDEESDEEKNALEDISGEDDDSKNEQLTRDYLEKDGNTLIEVLGRIQSLIMKKILERIHQI
jgi:hypothetical protein